MTPKYRLRISVLLIVGLVFALSGRSESASVTLYYLKDGGKGQWCGYKNLTEWKEQVQLRGALVVGGIDLAENHVSTVHVTTADETGDWSVNDEYTLDEKEKLHDLKRTINVIPEDLKQELVFAIHGGNAIKRGSVLRELQTGKVASDRRPVDWLKPPRVATEVHQFPFWPLVMKRQEIWSKGRACVSAAATNSVHP